MCFRKFETVGMLPKRMFDDHASIYALTERVIDGDTIRVRHLPLYSWRWCGRRSLIQPLTQRGIAHETLSIRIYAVDCPELSKRKAQPSQPYADEAKAFTTELCLHKVVKITLLSRDQYGRAVAVVETMPRWGPWLRRMPGCGRRDVSMELAHRGLAELYTSGGAQYFGRRDRFDREVQQAQRRGVGIWSLPNRVSAAEHKRQERGGGRSGQTNNKKKNSGKENAKPGSAKINKKTTSVRGGGTSRPPKSALRAVADANNIAKSKTAGRREGLLDMAITGLEVIGG